MQNNVSADDLKIFLAVLKERGFRAAAKRLGIAPSKVSSTITSIERNLGVPLLLRSTRSVRATEAGERLAGQICPLFEQVDAALQETSDQAGQIKGSLKLNVPGAVVVDIMPPILAAFRQKHPLVEVELVVENIMVDIIAAGCHAGIRYGSGLAKDMVSIPIGPRKQQFALAASPRYLQLHGRPQKPEDLVEFEAIRFRLPDGALLPWRLQNGATSITIEPGAKLVLSVNATNGGLGYARAGLGIVGAFSNWLDEDFKTGRLVPVLAEHWAVIDGPRLYYPSRLAPAPLRAFIELCSMSTYESP